MKVLSKHSVSPRSQLEEEVRRIASLSGLEREVSVMVAKGLTNSQIGTGLSMSSRTVRRHLTSVFGKLGISNRFELIIFCYRHRLTKPPEDPLRH